MFRDRDQCNRNALERDEKAVAFNKSSSGQALRQGK